MMDEFSTEEIVARAIAMPVTQRVRCLMGYAHELTIRARAYFLEEQYESARGCNEALHQITGHIHSLLSTSDPSRDVSFMEMIVRAAQQSGHIQVLARSLESDR